MTRLDSVSDALNPLDNVFSNGPNSPVRPPPAEHLGSPIAPINASHRPSHSRSESMASVARHSKRLSLSFPVQPGTRPTSWASSSPATPPESIASPTESSGSFLTVLATQERRVLELKEELRQAELELLRLKKHWASHEATRKRQDVHRVQALQPLSATLASLEGVEDDEDGSSVWMTREMERRKALIGGVKTSSRKVFSGSRHTRTLSLLSPDKGAFSQPFPQPDDIRKQPETSPTSSAKPLRPAHTRSTTLSAVPNRRTVSPEPPATAIPKDALLRTGKQMAADIKDGIWTFLEDIRQATVGEEGVSGGQSQSRPGQQGQPGRKTSSSSMRPDLQRANSAANSRIRRTDNLIDIGGSFWRDHGLAADEPAAQTAKPKTVRRTTPTKSNRRASQTPQKPRDADDSWANWDTPNVASTSSNSSMDSTRSSESSERGQGTPLTRASGRASLDAGIAWPALGKLSPGNLRRTATTLINEWEKSLGTGLANQTPVTTKDASGSDYDSGLEYPLPTGVKKLE